MMFRLFRKAGATGHVFLLRNGRVTNKGVAYSGLIGPMTTVAVVPTTSQILSFAIEAQTRDRQRVVVRGTLTAAFLPATAVSRFDFTVDPRSGGYVGNWSQSLNALVVERVLRAVLARVLDLDVEQATRSQREVEQAVTSALADPALAGDGISVSSCSVPNIEPEEEDIAQSIGATERQAMLTEADRALHERRIKAAENERAVKRYEAETEIDLERKRADLLEVQAQNKQKEAAADAEAMRIRLAPLADVESGKLVGAALVDAAKTGKLGSLAITSEFLAAVGRR